MEYSYNYLNISVTRIIKSISVLLIFTLAACSQQSNTNPDTVDLPSDQEITSTVKAQLDSAADVPADSISVNTTNGIVGLSGSTTNLLAKRRATEITESITGVISVINNLKVTADRPDQAIKEDVSQALRTDPATEKLEITTTVNNGLVTLMGNVDSWQEKQLAGAIASGVKGVTDIENNILVSVKEERKDANIEAEVSKTLLFDNRIRDNLITVNVTNDTVRLSGSVGSATEKQLAIQKAHVKGVESVQADQLEVHPEYNNDRFLNSMLSSLTPVQIKKALYNTFVYDPRVPADEIEITIKNGVATLDGSVKNLSAKLAAEKDAKNTAGITSVKNNITVERKVVVRPEIPTTDEAIKNHIKNSIIRDPYVEEAVLSIDVEKGLVTLNGNVNSKFEKRHIGDIAADVKGVININNKLNIKPSSGETMYE